MKVWKQTAALSALLMSLSGVSALAYADVTPTSAPVDPVPSSTPAQRIAMEIRGPVTFEDLEGGFYAVGGWRLIGDRAEFARYLGQEVEVTGIEFTGISYQMVRAIHVSSIRPMEPVSPPTEVSARRSLPKVILVNGKAITWDQGPLVADGLLLVPLRAIAEAAGGKVTWNGEEQSIAIRLLDRTVQMAIGESKAEMNQDGVYYFTRNLIAMAAAPRIVGNRTLISAEALSSILGLLQAEAEADVLSLVPAATRGGPAEVEKVTGTIKTVEKGRILVEGPAMANGEPMRLWLTVTAETKITVGEAAGTVADLTAGAEVVAELTGPILESYPAQGRAASIQVTPAAPTGMIAGTIKTVEEGRILVAGEATANSEPILWLFIREETKIVRVVNGQEQAATAADLAVGQQVEAVYSGPMLKSYPGQVGADLVRILK